MTRPPPGEAGADAEGEGAPPAGPWRRARENPWWIPPVLGRAPRLPVDRITMVGAVSLAVLFENFDTALLTAAAKQIAASFRVEESELASLFSWIHLGSVVAILLVPLADVLGRRRVFLASVVGLALATTASGLAQSIGQFVVLQMFARVFVVTTSATAYVILAEELPAAHRGWGVGIIGAMGSVGYGLGLLAFGVVDAAGGSWRLVYAAGLAPILLLPRLRKHVKETRRFQQRAADAPPVVIDAESALGLVWRPLSTLFARFPARALGVGLVAALASASQSSALQFSAFFVQTEHGWSPWQYALMAFFAGGIGILGNAWAGRAADRHGRRRVGFVVLASFPVCALAFFHGPELLVPLAWIALVFTLTGTTTIERALGAELFPTDLRGTASGWVMLSEALGRVSGFGFVAWLTPAGGSVVPALSWVAMAALVAAVLVLLLPETGRRELEEIAP